MFKDKSAKEAALQKLMDLMDEHEANDLKGLKDGGSAAVLEVEPKEEEQGEDEDQSDFAKAWDAHMKGKSMDDEGEHESEDMPGPEASADEPSEDEKAKIAALYHRYCK